MIVWVIGLLLALAGGAGAQQVAEEELKSAGAELEFVNYSGPYGRIDTAEEIKAIGFVLASSLKQEGRTGRFLAKYSVIRAVDPKETGRFDADILSIDPEAKVDHIDNVRRILAGYLEGAFRYSPEDARTLSRFATVYNAVHRGELAYFGLKYKAVVMGHLSPQNAGLARRYDEWPGKTRLLIPLGAEAAEGKLGALSTTELAEEKVIEEMRRQPDMGLEDRKDMVELKEREIEERKAEAEAAEKRLEEEKAELAEKEEALAEARTGEERAALEKEVAESREEVKKAEEEVAAREAAVAAKEEEVAEERAGIISDERSREARAGEAKPAAVALADQLYYLKVRPREPSGSISGSLSILDPGVPKIKLTSPVAYIRGRAYYFLKNTILVLAQEGSASAPARLILLDPLSLEPLARSTEELYTDSYVLIQGGSIYAVVKSGAEHRLARFDENLTLAARSSAAVDRDSSFSLFAGRIYVNSASREVLALDAADLSEKARVR